MRFPASGLNETARFVLGYGRHAEVLEPLALRQLVGQHLRQMTRFYEDEATQDAAAVSNPGAVQTNEKD